MHGVTVSEFMKQSVLERIEDEIDIGIYNEGIEEYKRYPVSHSLEEIEKRTRLIKCSAEIHKNVYLCFFMSFFLSTNNATKKSHCK